MDQGTLPSLSGNEAPIHMVVLARYKLWAYEAQSLWKSLRYACSCVIDENKKVVTGVTYDRSRFSEFDKFISQDVEKNSSLATTR